MNIVDLLDGVIRKPVATLNLIAREKPIGWALAIFVVSALLGSIAVDHSALEGLLGPHAPNAIFQIAGYLIGLFILTGLLFLVSRIFRGSGDYWGLFSALGFAQFPGFLVPVTELVKDIGGAAGSILGGIMSPGLRIWVLVLCIVALRESRGITTGNSIFTYLIAIFVVAALALLGVVAIAFMLRGSL